MFGTGLLCRREWGLIGEFSPKGNNGGPVRPPLTYALSVISMWKAKLLTFVYSVLLLSCGEKSEHASPKVPPVFRDRLTTASRIEDVFSQKHAIALEASDNSFVGDITYLHISPERYFAIIHRASRVPTIFDSTGRFVGKLGRAGKGPGEFGSAAALVWIQADSSWYIADNASRRISVFGQDLIYKRSFNVDSRIHSMDEGPGATLLLFAPGMGDVKDLIIALSREGKEMRRFYSTPAVIKEVPYYVRGGGLCVTEKRIFTSYYLDSELLCFNEVGELIAANSLDLMRNYVPADLRKVNDPNEFLYQCTGILRVLKGPENTIVVEYGNLVLQKERKDLKRQLYLAFFDLNGKLIASGIKTEDEVLASDGFGNLYSVHYEEMDRTEQKNPVLHKWSVSLR